MATIADDSQNSALKVVKFQSSQDHDTGIALRPESKPQSTGGIGIGQPNLCLPGPPVESLTNNRTCGHTARDRGTLVPKNGHTLVVGIIARISGCANQKEMSLDHQVDHAKEVVAEMYEGHVEYCIIATKGKGERLDRPELVEIEQAFRSRELDFAVQEDVGRLVCGADAVRLWGLAVDHGTRCLAPNDCCDTQDDTWEQDLLNACAEHVGHNAHTSKRIKQKKMNRFKKFGSATPCESYGYTKLEGAKTFEDWRKDETATPIIQEALRRLKASLNCSAVADWLNQQGVPVGKYCGRRGRKLKKWTGAMVRRYFSNPLLKGQPGRGFRHTIKHHETGRRISVPNPKGPIFRDCPHLAHVDPIEFDEVNASLKAKNDKFRRAHVSAAASTFCQPSRSGGRPISPIHWNRS